MAAQGGDVPRWPLANVYTGCMEGSHANVIMADNWVKGIRNWDLAGVYPAVRRQATQPTAHVSTGRLPLAAWADVTDRWCLLVGFAR
jgi:putative alpha-1,2-mannosidase